MKVRLPKYSLFILFFAFCLIFSQSSALFASPSLCSKYYRSYLILPSDAYDAHNFIIKNERNYKLLPEIALKDIEDLVEIENDGEMNLGTSTAKLNGQNVFLKNSGSHGAKEGLWLLYLNQRGLGVHFYGVVKIGSEYMLVMENAPGTNIKPRMEKRGVPIDFKITKAMITEMHRQIELLYKAGLMVVDPQFLISAERITLIDVSQTWSLRAYMHEMSLQDVLADIDFHIDTWRSWGHVKE